MQKRTIKIQVADDTVKRLHEMGLKLGDAITPNGIAAMAAYEISRVKPEMLWHALGAIRAMADEDAPAPLPEPKRHARAAELQIAR